MNIQIETAEADDPRIQAAFGWSLGLGHDASETEIKNALLKHMSDTTVGYEQMKHSQEFTPPPFETRSPTR